ncbi:histidine kinase [Pedococcus sp. KACC 23699]|uniref:histidine kinase n=1 Tax=Pedococcus sp. KACC 23699 TaxID=3149228 RepID=A0AAU7JTR5_9MICO
MTWPRRLSVLAACLTAAVLSTTCAVAWSQPTAHNVLVAGVASVVGGLSTMCGCWVAVRHAQNALGYLLVLPGLQAALIALETVGGSTGFVRVPGSDYVVAASQGAWVFIYVVVAVPLLFFPSGHLSSRFERVLLGVLVGDAVLFTVVSAVAPGPFLAPNELAPHVFGTLPPAVADVLVVAALVVLPVTLGAVAVHVFRRHRGAVGAARRQFRWLALSAGLLPLALLGGWVSYLVVGNADVVLLAGLLTAYVTLPALMATAVVRPELFDPARLLAGATTHMVATAGLLTVFTGVSAVAGLVLAQGAPEVALAATAACVLSLGKLHRPLQRSVDRWLYPARQVAFAAITALESDILTGTGEPEELQHRLAQALRDETLTVRYQATSLGQDAELHTPQPVRSGNRSTEVRLGDQTVGTLTARADLSAELLRDIADRMASLVELGRVRVDLRRALQDADDSRARLLRVGYQERAKLERDLHDGAQQRLVALGMALRLAQRRLSRGVDVSEVLDAAVAELGTAVGELRQLAHGIRPSCLDDGLERALGSLVAAAPLPVTVHVETVDLDKDLETTAYYVASEAIANAIKHSGADRIALHVSTDHGQLHVKVADNGAGQARATPGSGLTGLRDRVGAHGGRLLINSGTGQGTVVEAVLPCA